MSTLVSDQVCLSPGEANFMWGCKCGMMWVIMVSKCNEKTAQKDFSFAINGLNLIIIAVVFKGLHLMGYKLIFRCDSESVVAFVSSQCNKELHVMRMM